MRPAQPPSATGAGTGDLIDGSLRHLRIGGGAIIDAAVALSAMAGDVVTACVAAARRFGVGRGGVVDRHGRGGPPAGDDATRPERRDPAIDAGNRPVARGLETAGEGIALAGPGRTASRAARRSKTLTPEQQPSVLGWGTDLDVSWSAPATTDPDRNELPGTPLAVVRLDRPAGRAVFVLRGKVGALTGLRVPLTTPTRVRTDEDTIDPARHLAVHDPDPQIGGIVNRQNRSTATGSLFTAGRVPGLLRPWEHRWSATRLPSGGRGPAVATVGRCRGSSCSASAACPVEDATGISGQGGPVDPISQLAFDLDLDVVSAPPPVIGRPPDDLPEQDRAAAVRKLASLIARHHASGGSADDNE